MFPCVYYIILIYKKHGCDESKEDRLTDCSTGSDSKKPTRKSFFVSTDKDEKTLVEEIGQILTSFGKTFINKNQNLRLEVTKSDQIKVTVRAVNEQTLEVRMKLLKGNNLT